MSTKHEPPRVDSADAAWNWVFFVMGCASQGCWQNDTGDKHRDARGQWAGRMLARLVPVVSAALRVALKHPDEFRDELGEPVELERLP